MPDPDLEISVCVCVCRGGGGGGGGGGGWRSSRPLVKRGVVSKNIFRPLEPQFGLKIRGGGGGDSEPGPSPGSSTDLCSRVKVSCITSVDGI